MTASHHTGEPPGGNFTQDEDHYGRGGHLYGTELILERIIFASRWLLMPMFVGLAAALALFSMNFVLLIYKFGIHIFEYDKNELLLMMLTFVDKVLVGTLIIMVIISGYENSVGKLNVRDGKLSWLGKLDSSSLKIKLATSIVSISSIHLLKIFLDVGRYTNMELAWTTGIHFTMVLTAIMLASMDRLQGQH
ncbi:MAG: TIGR00645 family protein [Alphaproteobacteria bacterium]